MAVIHPFSFQKELRFSMRGYLSYVLALILLFLSMGVRAVPVSQPDSAKMSALNLKLDEYMKAISHESLDVQKQECDFIIESTKDSLVRTAVARRLLSSYMDSPLMGAEAVAVHLLDRWFLNGVVTMPNETDLLNARIYADFNRQSLLGCPAPELVIKNKDGEQKTVFPNERNRYTVLYFYDADCAKCRIQSVLLRNLLNTENHPVDFVAVYTGDDLHEWDTYVAARLDVTAQAVSVEHLWDPEVDSDFQRKYGVIQTPRMFLVSPDGVIVGRGLDARALSQMLQSIFLEKTLNYGTQESVALYDMVFGRDAVPSDKSEIAAVADHVAASTIEKGDTVMFRQMTGDLLYYLSPKREEAFREGLDYVIDEYILSRPKVWRSQDDSLKVVGMALLMDDLLSKTAPGSKVAPVKVSGELVSSNGSKMTIKSLDRIGGKRNYIFFFAQGCNVCAAEKDAMHAMMADSAASRGVKVFLVDVDGILMSDPGLASMLFDSFDLSSLPFIIETDAKGRVLRRYTSFRF